MNKIFEDENKPVVTNTTENVEKPTEKPADLKTVVVSTISDISTERKSILDLIKASKNEQAPEIKKPEFQTVDGEQQVQQVEKQDVTKNEEDEAHPDFRNNKKVNAGTEVKTSKATSTKAKATTKAMTKATIAKSTATNANNVRQMYPKDAAKKVARKTINKGMTSDTNTKENESFVIKDFNQFKNDN